MSTARLDRETREAIRDAVRQSMAAAMTQMEEVWLTGPDLCKQFGMFTPKWLKNYGDTLPRRRVIVTGMDGKSHSTRWAYPKHEIAANIAAGLYDDVRIFK